MAKHIKIHSVTGPSDGTALDGFYFEESGAGYNFYQPTHPTPTQLNTDLITPSNPTFHFNLSGFPNPFYITITSFPAVLQMSGSWSDNSQVKLKDVPGSGTFQAEASGTGPVEGEEEAQAACAK
jgi:hypothetical protein